MYCLVYENIFTFFMLITILTSFYDTLSAKNYMYAKTHIKPRLCYCVEKKKTDVQNNIQI